MPTSNDFENKRRERRRRERLRKKRIRAAVIIIALAAVIVMICVAVSTCSNGDTASVDNIDAASVPAEATVPTVEPVQQTMSMPAAAEENDLLTILRNSGQTKHCYLTFDDGPTNITPKVLDVLRRYNVKATFFEVGSLIEANPDTARRVYEEGHLIANHSDGHNYEKLYASTDSFINEINKCYETIKSVGNGEDPFRLIRFPGGSYKSSADSYSPVKQECKTVLKDNGYYYCDWNALNGDAEGKKKDASELLEYMKRNLDGEENVVVLMHDAATKQATVDALPSIIEYFISEGYTFHRLDDVTYQAQTAPVTTAPAEGDNTEDDAQAASSPTPAPTNSTVTHPSAKPSTSSSGAIVIQ